VGKTEDTDARRERVAELWGKRDPALAVILVEEGFFGLPARSGRRAETQMATARRTLRRDRDYWRERWATESAAVRRMSSGEYLANLSTNVGELRELFEGLDDYARPKDRVDVLHEIRQTLEAIASASRTSADPGGGDGGDGAGGGNQRPYLGLVVGLERVSPEAREKIEKWVKTANDGELRIR